MNDRGPCPCGRERGAKAVCPDCWAHADRVLKARCLCPDPGLRREAVRDLLRFAASRRDQVRQPEMTFGT